MLRWQRVVAAASLSVALWPLTAYSNNNTSVVEPTNSGWSLHMDNDLFTPRHQDRDYTGGLTLTFAGSRVRDWPISLDSALNHVNDWLGTKRENTVELHSLQIGLAAFAPEDITNPNVIHDDRPYANLLFVANSQVQLHSDGQTATQSTLTLGVLGTSVANDIQRGIHKITHSDPPEGWRHQIANGGEPTFRYTLAHQRMWHSQNGLEIKQSCEGSIGFITEANSAVSLRWGRIKTPWWSFTPDRAEYFAQPSTGLLQPETSGPAEFYVWTGAKLRVRAYNAFLQGQFRDSELAYSWSEVRPVLGEAWVGVTRQVSPHTRLSWVFRYQTSELRQGHGDRELVWGSIFLNRDF